MNKSDPAPDTQPANELSFRNAIHLAPLSHINDIVERALDACGVKSEATPAGQRFDAAVKASGIRPPNHERHPLLAPKSQLLTPVREQVVLSDPLAGAVLGFWAENEKDLRTSVEDYARANDIPIEGPDLENRQFRDLMPLKTWNAAIGSITSDKKNPCHPHDASIMLCMVTGNLPRLISQANGVGGADRDLPFDKWLEELKSSLASPAGTGAAARYVNSASKIVEDRQQEEERISDLIGKSIELCRDFMPELVFLGREMPANLTNRGRTLAGQAERLDDALNVIDQLGAALETFRAVSSVEYATWDLWKQGTKKEAEAANHVQSLIEQLHAVLPEPAPPPVQEVEPEPQTDDTTAELIALRAKNLDLETENDALRAKLFKANQRLAALWSADNNKADPPETTPVDSVGEAVARAREQFEWKELLFYLNGASNVDTEFERPPEVFDALKWLATTYRTGRMNGGMADPEHSLKSVCSGWKYAPDNSVMAMNQYPEAYSTQGGGKAYDLACHIKKGVDNKESHTIRIAWDWDDEQKMAVVGYIGKHQPSKF